MAVDDWVLVAVQALARGQRGASLREVQRYIDERYHEELAVDTLQQAFERLIFAGKLQQHDERYVMVPKTNKTDAMNKLFGKS